MLMDHGLRLPASPSRPPPLGSGPRHMLPYVTLQGGQVNGKQKMAEPTDESLPELGNLEREVLQLVWANAPVTAETVRERLSRPLKESTVRTVLRRLEDNGYTTHTVD